MKTIDKEINKLILKDVEQILGEQIDFSIEVHKETPSDYNEGYVDGLRQALEVLTELFGRTQ